MQALIRTATGRGDDGAPVAPRAAAAPPALPKRPTEVVDEILQHEQPMNPRAVVPAELDSSCFLCVGVVAYWVTGVVST